MAKPFLIFSVLILIQILFGLNYSASKIVVQILDPFIWSSFRFLFAGIIMFAMTLALKRSHPKPDKNFYIPLFALSILGMASGQGLLLFGLKHTTSINTAILTSTIPLLTILIAVLRKQEKINLLGCTGLLLALAGVVFIRDFTQFSLSGNTLLGDSCVFMGAICFALFLNYGKKFLMSHDNLWVTSYMFFISSFCIYIFNLFRGVEFIMPTLSNELIIAGSYSVLGATVLTYFLNNWALKRASSGNVAIFIYLQPLIAGAIGYLYLNEEITNRMVLCSLLILMGLGVNLYSKKEA